MEKCNVVKEGEGCMRKLTEDMSSACYMMMMMLHLKKIACIKEIPTYSICVTSIRIKRESHF